MKGQIIPVEANGNGTTNGNHVNETLISNGTHTASKEPLRILIVGAGIGGLTAAIALRQQGHHVEVFEQSQFASELGAAVHLAPNSNGILRRLGIYAEKFGSNLFERFSEYNADGTLKREIDLRESNKIWQHPHHLAHRVHLHDALKKAATSNEGTGEPVVLTTASRVTVVDEQNATVTLLNGETVEGDVIIGADGVHSVTRDRIAPDAKPYGCGKSAFRFLITREAAKGDPTTASFVRENGELIIWYGHDRRVVMYPTSDNQLLNFVCIHPAEESDVSSDWNNEGSLDAMLRVFKDFDTSVTTLLAKADAKTLKVWKLLDMDEIPVWAKDRLALLGDAAHPFLPHQGQGAGAAIEDAASIAVVLPLGTSKDEVSERLALYDSIRHERATRVQHYSRIIGGDGLERDNLDSKSARPCFIKRA